MHVMYAEAVKDRPGWYRAICSCGTKGRPRPTRRAAWNDLDEHWRSLPRPDLHPDQRPESPT